MSNDAAPPENDRYVVELPNGGWVVQTEAGDRASDMCRSQEEAMNRARAIVRSLGGGAVIVKGRDGRVRMRDSVPPPD